MGPRERGGDDATKEERAVRRIASREKNLGVRARRSRESLGARGHMTTHFAGAHLLRRASIAAEASAASTLPSLLTSRASAPCGFRVRGWGGVGLWGGL